MINLQDEELRNKNDDIHSKKPQMQMNLKEKQEFQSQVAQNSNLNRDQPLQQKFSIKVDSIQDFNQVSENKQTISQLYDPKKKENDQIMQLYHIRNQYTLIS